MAMSKEEKAEFDEFKAYQAEKKAAAEKAAAEKAAAEEKKLAALRANPVAFVKALLTSKPLQTVLDFLSTLPADLLAAIPAPQEAHVQVEKVGAPLEKAAMVAWLEKAILVGVTVVDFCRGTGWKAGEFHYHFNELHKLLEKKGYTLESSGEKRGKCYKLVAPKA